MKTRWLIAASLVLASSAAHAERDRTDLLTEASERSAAGDHEGAIDIYEHVYRTESDLDLLVRIGSEYRAIGKPLESLRYFCTYLTLEPAGPNAPFASNEVVALQSDLGNWVPPNNVCAPGTPLFGRPVMPPTVPVPNTIQMIETRTLPPVSTRERAGITLGAVGLIGITTGLIYGFKAKGISDDIANHDNSQPWPDNIQQLEARGQHDETMQSWLVLGGGAALVTGGVLYFTGRADRMSRERVSITPNLSKSSTGIAITGAF